MWKQGQNELPAEEENHLQVLVTQQELEPWRLMKVGPVTELEPLGIQPEQVGRLVEDHGSAHIVSTDTELGFNNNNNNNLKMAFVYDKA